MVDVLFILHFDDHLRKLTRAQRCEPA